MRPPRVAILVLFSAASLFLVCRSISSLGRPRPAAQSSTTQKSSFRTFFSFSAPFSLFPPSAAISLTDDNSTFFPARPAAFGPPLPPSGLSGQLWIGSGFSDESLQDGEGEGELGCSDIPGWEDGRSEPATLVAENPSTSSKHSRVSADKKSPKSDLEMDPVLDRDKVGNRRSESVPKRAGDGTDDHLHQRFQQTRSTYSEGGGTSESNHADIQSIQETAEITGKVVLLSRGGCGFLEKVKWAQRRGAIAVIVGDNQKGGPLIQMFARGNVDNVTIPSVFTSRTTAHLLSSLTQPGSFIEDMLDDNGRPTLNVQHSAKTGRSKKAKKGTSTTGPASRTSARESSAQQDTATETRNPLHSRRSWISRVFRWSGIQGAPSEKVRSASASRFDGDRPDTRNENKDKNSRDTLGLAADGGANSERSEPKAQNQRDPGSAGLAVDGRQAGKTGRSPSADIIESARRGSSAKGLDGEDDAKNTPANVPNGGRTPTTKVSSPVPPGAGGNGAREGLWVTITPTGSASPFFDTLLVLVISPLITLTVVYALLILRVKIRMRRWRAPKSVVDQLPVRTYHTVAPSPSQSPRTPSPASSSPTTPLLQGSSRSRPRSHTTTGVQEAGASSSSDDVVSTTRTRPREKNSGGVSSEWRKYMGRQVECVVCLEEYVDGVSRVMSLPCGHEFHAECITPWLTTRRRTCPICKSDVVRSLARHSSPGPQYESFREDGYDSSGESSDTFRDRAPSPDRVDDLERGSTWTQASRQDWPPARHDAWFSSLTSRWGSSSSFLTGRDSSTEERGRR